MQQPATITLALDAAHARAQAARFAVQPPQYGTRGIDALEQGEVDAVFEVEQQEVAE